MSRLYDRVMAEGCKPFRLDALVPASYIRQERGEERPSVPTAQYAYTRDDLADIPVITLDEAAEYVASLTVGDAGKLKSHPSLESFFGVIRPPFDRCFLEFPLRFWMGTTGIGAGWVAEVEELGEQDPSSPSWLAEARWLLSLSLIVEPWKKGLIFGPCITHVIPLNAHGEPCHPEDEGAGVSDRRPPLSPPPTEGELRYWRGIALYLGFPAIFGLSLINCKNVDIRAVDPPERLSKKNERRRGRPLTHYYVLDITPMRRILDTEGEAQTRGLGHALHICRGHFKTFAEDAPLFGKHAGTYWWASQVRGKAEHGIVEKDYRVRLDDGPPTDVGLGRGYAEVNEHPDIKPSAPEHTGLDPDLGGRGLRAHNITQNLLGRAVREAGYIPTNKPHPSEPQYDLAWEVGDVTWVAEVKSLTPQNEEKQLRMALGQVLRYCQLMEEEGRTVRPMIATEVKPSEASWVELCAREGIALVWGPDNLVVGVAD